MFHYITAVSLVILALCALTFVAQMGDVIKHLATIAKNMEPVGTWYAGSIYNEAEVEMKKESDQQSERRS